MKKRDLSGGYKDRGHIPLSSICQHVKSVSLYWNLIRYECLDSVMICKKIHVRMFTGQNTDICQNTDMLQVVFAAETALFIISIFDYLTKKALFVSSERDIRSNYNYTDKTLYFPI